MASEQSWTEGNLAALWDAFIRHPDTSDKTFYDKWKGQLVNQSNDVHRIAADVIAFYHLFPSNISGETKLSDVKLVAAWKLGGEQPDYSLLQKAFSTSIGSPGMYYLTGRPWQVAFYIDFAIRLLSQKARADDPNACKTVADHVANSLKNDARAARNILLHLLFPDQFERVSSDTHKQQIVKSFKEYAGDAQDLDDALFNIRSSLKEKTNRPELDFYDPDILVQWDTTNQGNSPGHFYRFIGG